MYFSNDKIMDSVHIKFLSLHLSSTVLTRGSVGLKLSVNSNTTVFPRSSFSFFSSFLHYIVFCSQNFSKLELLVP